MDKIEYSTDTRVATIPGASLSTGTRQGVAATSAKENALPQPTYPGPTPNFV